ncbi:MAG: prepilin-type N-terminal cleavage/methylation domain-containing protein [Pseudanabaenaceae cyanobacterium]|jgi:prepilin-type N-terminal cleavage/methylation domain-containing protein
MHKTYFRQFNPKSNRNHLLNKLGSKMNHKLKEWLGQILHQGKSNNLRQSVRRSGSTGFTLLELLVAMTITSIIVTVLLTFLVGLLSTNREEEAKSASQEEIQSALRYIADDVQEAVYIYDSEGIRFLTGNYSTTLCTGPSNTANPQSCSQIPTGANMTPVLVFWKRQTYDSGDTAPNTTALTRNLGYFASDGLGPTQYTYSLVGYYLIKGDVTTDASGTSTQGAWSRSARIARWELRDGVECSKAVSCTDRTTSVTTTNTVTMFIGGPSGAPTSGTAVTYTASTPDSGFQKFLTGGSGTTLTNMNSWQKGTHTGSYGNWVVLLDYLDDTPYATTHDNKVNTDGPIEVGIGPNTNDASGNPSLNADCSSPDIGVGTVGGTSNTAERIPAFFNTAANPSGLTSFYACVYNSGSVPNTSIARVWLRGNARARMTDSIATRPITEFNSHFLTLQSVRVMSKGVLAPSDTQ